MEILVVIEEVKLFFKNFIGINEEVGIENMSE